MNQGEGLAGRLAAAPLPLAATGAIVLFTIALLGAIKLGLPIWSLLAVGAVAIYAFLVMNRPILGLQMIICTVFLPFHFGGYTLLQVVGIGTASLILIAAMIQRRSLRLEPILLPFLVIGVLICASLWYARDVERVTAFFKIWVFNMVFVLLLTNLVTRFSILKRVVWTIIGIASLNVVVGIYQFVTTNQSGYRALGLLEHTGRFGHLTTICFALSLYQFLYRTDRLKWVALGFSILFLGGVVACAGRTPTFTTGVVLLLAMLTERRRRAPLALVIALCLCAAPFLPTFFFSRVDNLFTDAVNTTVLSGNEDLTGRGMLNKTAIKLWLSHPLTGVGIGNFGHYFVDRDINPGFKRSDKVPPHNTYLQALAEMGVLGLAALLWAMFLATRYVLKTRRICFGDINRWTYFGGIQMMILVVLITSVTGTHILRHDFWMYLCLAAVAYRIALTDRAEAVPEQGPADAGLDELP